MHYLGDTEQCEQQFDNERNRKKPDDVLADFPQNLEDFVLMLTLRSRSEVAPLVPRCLASMTHRYRCSIDVQYVEQQLSYQCDTQQCNDAGRYFTGGSSTLIG